MSMQGAAPEGVLNLRFLDPDRDRQQTEAMIADFGLGGRELADGVILIRAGQGAKLRKEHLLPQELVTYATGPDVQVNGPRVKEFRGEEALLGKFLEVSDPRKVTVCYTQGHGEPAFDDLEPFNGYAHLRELLRDAKLETKLAQLDDAAALLYCDVILVAGPTGLFAPEEVEALRRFTQRGGDLLILAGAKQVTGKPLLTNHGLEPLTADYGVHFGDRQVVDPHAVPGGTEMIGFTVLEGWADHAAVRSLALQPVALFEVRELWIDGDAQALATCSEQGWAESGLVEFQQRGTLAFDDGDRRGPIPVAAAGEIGDSRLVVVASDHFALNAWLREDVAYSHNRDLILNLIGWLTQRDVLMGIRPRDREHVKLVLLPEQLKRMTWMCLVGLPGFAILLGLMVLWRRRQ